MDDEVRISEEQFRHVYATAFKTWAQLYSHAIEDGKLPASCFFTQDSFPLQPTFPRNLALRHHWDQIVASGFSVWGSSPAENCPHGIPSFRRLEQLDVAVHDPVLLSISASAPSNCYSNAWFNPHSDYMSILILAWAYILSARWAEIMPTPCTLLYTDSQASYNDATTKQKNCQPSLVVDIGPANPEEARWWAAVLAQGQGWRATIQTSFLSPWSVRVESSTEFLLSLERNTLPSDRSASTFTEACGFLNRFCTRHNVIDQSHAALSAVLFFPYMAGQTLQVPSPSFNKQGQLRKGPIGHHGSFSDLHSIHEGQHLDRLLALSCNTGGIRSLLLSVFYEPSIECNAVTPWLQGSLAAIESLADSDPALLGRMCMDRTPEVACILLGSTILGLQKELLQEVHYGHIPFDLPSAVWSGSIQSFMLEVTVLWSRV